VVVVFPLEEDYEGQISFSFHRFGGIHFVKQLFVSNTLYGWHIVGAESRFSGDVGSRLIVNADSQLVVSDILFSKAFGEYEPGGGTESVSRR
jgi:hypothetical protein